jgi:pyruvate dehydrogenase E2 component (dihydrolipoamide acetyltransferase)
MANEIKLGKLKENVESYEVNEILVKPGEVVEKDQPLLVVNADKANMDVQSPVAGRVVQVRVKVGDQLKTGDVYVVIEGTNGEQEARPAPARNEVVANADRKGAASAEPAPREVKRVQQEVRPVAPPPSRVPPAPAPAPAPLRAAAGPDAGVVRAGPAARWLARKLGVDLHSVRGSGAQGRITEEDVKNAFGGGPVAVAAGAGVQLPALPYFEEFGAVEREPLTRVRRLTAQKMSLAWTLIPHVTQHDVADITDLEAFRKQQEARGLKLTVTAFALKACAIALKQFPTFNSSLDLAGGQLVLKRYYHIGVAVDTKTGLLVPVIRDVDRKGVEALARELTEVAEKARQGRADMDGGTFTITNLGGIGGTGFTPIINHPEVAILGMSRSRLQPVVRDGQVVPRLLLPLSLSYDHRVIDGAAAARFTRRLAEMLENPWTMLLHA